MWVDADDDHVLINTELERQKAVNVMKDPRVAVMIWDAETPYKYVEVRGRVVDIVRGDRARAHIDELSRKYLDHDYASPIGSERVILVDRARTPARRGSVERSELHLDARGRTAPRRRPS